MLEKNRIHGFCLFTFKFMTQTQKVEEIRRNYVSLNFIFLVCCKFYYFGEGTEGMVQVYWRKNNEN